MRTGRTFSRSRVGIVLLALISTPALPEDVAVSDIAVVVRPDTPVNDLTLPQLRKIFMGEREAWSSNLAVTLLVRGPGAREREVLLKVACRMSEAEFKQYWILRMFRAETTDGPRVVYSSRVMAQLVSSLPGSVAFIEVSEVPRGLRVLRIDGKLPGQPGYPLK